MDYTESSTEQLALTCFRGGNEPAWAEFVRRFQPLIAKVVFRVCHQWGEYSQEVMDDLVQDTYLKLCADRLRILRIFKPEHPDAIFGYIKVFTANLTHDHFKAAHSKKRGGDFRSVSVEGADPLDLVHTSMASSDSPDRNVLLQQIDTCLRAICSESTAQRDRRIFWLYYRVGLSANAIAALPTIGLTTKGVETALLRLTRLVRERLMPLDRAARSQQQKGIHGEESL